MRIQTLPAILSAWLICGAFPLYAHHAFDSEFDATKPVKLNGKVTRIVWGNPHVFFEVDAPSSTGGTVNWRVELTSANDLSKSGLNRLTVPVGSAVSVEGFAARSGERLIGTTQMTVAATGQIVMTPPASWHHSFSDTYDAANRIELTGTVTSIHWISEHATVDFAITLPNGQREEWQAEAGPAHILVTGGWKKDDLSTGDVIQVSGSTTKDGSLKLLAQTITLIAKSGRTLNPPKALLTAF